VAADFRADLDDAEDVAARIKFEDPMVVPLTQVKMIAVATLAVLSAWGMLLEKTTNTLVNKLVSAKKTARA
jgi:hypothetical protein